VSSKNNEAPKCSNTNGASIENNRLGNIDMNIVQRKDLTFQNVTFTEINHAEQTWLTSSELAKALGYKKSDAVTQIFSRYHDEFTDSMSTTLRLSVVRKTGSVDIPVRVFSLRGAHLVAMFATTDKAKEFRRWALDVLDREVTQSPIAKQFTDEELCQLCWLWRHATGMASYMMDVEPILTAAEHRLAPTYVSYPKDTIFNRNKVRRMLERETMHIKADHRTEDNWRVLRNLRIPELH